MNTEATRPVTVDDLPHISRRPAPGADSLAARLDIVTLGPADRLIVRVPADTTERDAERYRAVVEAAGFGDRVLILPDAWPLAVLRGEQT
jgi:hypothetical protein